MTYRVDQIIAGVVINLFVLGVTFYVSSQVYSECRFLNNAPVFRPVKIPLVGDLPVSGPVLFNENIFVYGAIIMVSVASYYLFHTRLGLRARSVGEHPRAADTLGSVGRFDENMTGRRGYIGLAAMIFGRWHPVGALMAALVFGFAASLQQKLALLNTPIPSEFLAMSPYVATIIVVAGLIGRSRPPRPMASPM